MATPETNYVGPTPSQFIAISLYALAARELIMSKRPPRAGAADLGAVTSNPIRVLVRHKVTLKPGAGSTVFVRSGTAIKYTATVRPIAPAGAQRVTFLIYRRVGGSWSFRTSATLSVNSSGVATFSWRWSRGDWYVRARANATIYDLAALSTIAKVTAR